MSDSKPTIHAALIAARAAIQPIPKSATNPHFGNRYAPLGDILAAVLPALHAQGLSLSSAVRFDPPHALLDVRLVHAPTGDAVLSSVPLFGATDMQKLGGAVTYAMRYAVGGLLALELDDDDDGNRASAPASPASRPAPRPSAPTGNNDAPCPRCGVSGYIRQLKSGKDAGRWCCIDWPEKGMKGCGGTYNSDPRKAAPPQADQPPPPGDDDLVF